MNAVGSSPARPRRTAVLIVGAGPVGLTLALALQRSGVPFRLLDKNAGPSTATKAMAVHSRTLEIFRDLGLAEKVVAAGTKIQRFRVRSKGKTILLYDFALLDAAYPFLLSIPQPRTEALLLAELEARGGRVEWRTAFAGLAHAPDHVTARIAPDGGEEEQVVCDWLVGCDGARSTVRGALGLPFQGGSYHRHFVLADVDIDWSGDPEEGAFFLGSAQGYVAVAPLDGKGRYRLFVEMPYDLPPDSERPPLELATFQSLCEGRGPAMRLARPSSMTIAAFHHRRAFRQKVGRVFLAGDAAHIGSPIGGQYMNLGIAEAHNLAWKLAAVHAGEACPDLLDSYDAERLPVAEAAEKTAHVLTRILTLRNPLLVRARDALFPRLSSLPRIRRRLPWMISGHRYHYQNSPLVEDTRGRAAPPRRQKPSGPAPRAGQLAPDLSLWQPRRAAPQRLLDRYQGRFTLLLFASGDEQAPDVRALVELGAAIQADVPAIRAHLVLDALERPDLGVPIQVLLDPDRRLHHRFAGATGPLVLIRPDGYIAFVGTDEAGLRRYLAERSHLRPAADPASALREAL